MGFPVFDLLARRADLSPGRTAVHDLGQQLRLSYRQLDQRTAAVAGLLLARGVRPGQRVALLCRNRVEFFELLFACARIEAVLVPLNWRMPASELALLMDDCGACLLLYGAEDEAVARQLGGPGVTLLGLDQPGSEGFAAQRAASAPAGTGGQRDGDQPWYLLYTSGTTGQPKAVIQTYTMVMANYVNISQGMGLRDSDTTLCYLPLFHAGGISLTALPTLIMGGELLISPGFDVDATVELLERGQLDTFFGVPAIYQAISLHEQFAGLDLSQVRCWGCGGAPMPEVLLAEFARRGALVLNGMGMTETGPTLFLMDREGARSRPGSVGKPQLLAAARIVDSNGQDVQPGDTGELWFAGPGITPGYFGRPAETAAAFSSDGWLRSGDLGRQDEEGYYYIVGRLKDMYISGGENVYPAEVENCLAAHPDVLEAAVVGVADQRWGEVGYAYLLPRPGHSLPPVEQLDSWLRQRLAAYKLPHHYQAVADFPRTAAGKVQKHLLVPTKEQQPRSSQAIGAPE
jgi:fatty-acyl-CoA synthase